MKNVIIVQWQRGTGFESAMMSCHKTDTKHIVRMKSPKTLRNKIKRLFHPSKVRLKNAELLDEQQKKVLSHILRRGKRISSSSNHPVIQTFGMGYTITYIFV